MNALPPVPFAASEDRDFPQEDADAAALRWAALTDAARIVAKLAGLGEEGETAAGAPITALLREADPWRLERAERGIADMSAFMEPGIAALLSVKSRGADPRPAAQALWHEFTAARAAVLTLLAPVRPGARAA